MPNPPSPGRTIDVEHQILRFLCAGANPSELRKRVVRELAGHTWAAPEHRVVYEALVKIRDQDSVSLREQLPAQATRMGFPDVDWAAYLDGPEEPESKLAKLVGELVSTSKEHP